MATNPREALPPSPGPSVVRFGFDVLDRVEQAVAMVKERLKRAVAALDSAGIPHAVVGGHAVAAWVSRIDPAAVRTTVDVDILIARADLERARAALEAVGFVHSFTFGIHIFVDGPTGKAREAVHILFAGETVKPNDPVPAPDLSATDTHAGYQIVDLDRLITMKLTAFRDKDRTHLRDMIDVGLIDASTVARLPPVLQPRLAQLLANPDG
ncbi:MAG: nucleotidyl transferase AbiEii/AbiGii toxin family protein [Planctomycetia bacterium]